MKQIWKNLTLVSFLLVSMMYIFFFYIKYETITFYLDRRLSSVYKLIWVSTYNLPDVLYVYIIGGFLLVTLGLVYFSNVLSNKNPLYIILFILVSGSLLFNILWILGILTIIIASLIIYIVVVTFLWKEEENIEFESGQIIKKIGPYNTREALEENCNFFINQWALYFEKLGFKLDEKITINQNKFSAEIIIETLKKSGF